MASDGHTWTDSHEFIGPFKPNQGFNNDTQW